MKDVLKMTMALWMICGAINLGGLPRYLKSHPISFPASSSSVSGYVLLGAVIVVAGPIWLGATLQKADATEE